MIRRNRRGWAAIAITLSMLMGTEAALPPIAYAREAQGLSSLIFDTYGTSGSSDLTLAAAGVEQDPKEIGKFTFGKNAQAEPGPIAKTLPLIKNAGFDFVEEIVPVYSWVDEDGSQIVTLNINQKNTALWKDVINQKASLWETAKRNFNNVQKKGGPKFKPVFSLQALTKSKNGKTTMGEAACMAGMMGSVQGQFFIFTGEFSLTGTGGAKAGFQYDTSQGPQINGNVDINFGLTPKIAGGVGLAYIGRFGVYGTGTVETSIRILPPKDAGWNYARLKATLGLEVIALVFRVWHKDLWNGGPWDLVTPRAGLKAQSEGYDVRPLFVAAADDEVEVIPIYALPTSRKWYGHTHEYVDDPSTLDSEDDDTHEGDTFSDDDMTNELSTPQLGLRLLREDVYPDAQVEVVRVKGGAVMCWLESAFDDSEMNVTRLKWSRYDATTDTWSDPKLVDTGAGSETADFEPDLFADQDGNVHAVWLNASRDVPSYASDIETVTDLLEVRYAKLTDGENDFGPSEVVSPADITLVQQAEEAALSAQEEERNAEDSRPSTTDGQPDAADDCLTADEGDLVVDNQADTTDDGTVSVQSEEPESIASSETDDEVAEDPADGAADKEDDQDVENPAEALRAQSDEAGNVTLVAQEENITGYFRTSPQVAASGDDVLVGWSTTPCENLLDYEGDHQVIVAKRTLEGDGTSKWTAKRAIDYRSDMEVTSLDAGLLGTRPAVAWTANELYLTSDGTVTSGTKHSELLVVTGEDIRAFGSNKDFENVDFAHKGEKEGALTWSEKDTDGSLDLMVLENPRLMPYMLLDDADLPPNYQIDGDLEGSALVSYQGWESGETEDESTTDIYGRVLTVGADLSEENLLVAHEDDLTSHSVAYLNGSPLVALAAERGIGDEGSDVSRSADLLVAHGDSLERLSVNDLVFEVDEVAPNAQVEAKVIVDNAGLVPITGGVSAEIIDDHTGNTLGTGSYSGEIAVGEQAEIPVAISVPADFDPELYRDITVKVNFEGERQARDTTALNLETILYGPELSIPEGDDSSKGDGEDDTNDTENEGDKDEGKDKGKDKGGKRSDATPSRDRTSGKRTRSLIGRWFYDGTWGFNDDYAHTGSTGTTSSVTTTPKSTSAVSRISGQNRYDTMRATVLTAFGKSDWAILASGEDFADALAAQALAGARRAPVVLTAQDRLSPQARDVLERLGCRHVVVVGGPSAVSEAALSEARSVSGDAVRVAGTDRYATSLAALRAAKEAGAASDTVFVATGTGFADALSAGPLSWRTASPVVLVGPDGTLGTDALNAIRSDSRIRRVMLLGGEAVVSEAVRGQLGSGYTYVRLGGKDRYQTSTAVASWAATQGLGWANPHVATGASFADALAGAAAAGSRSSCLLLADGASSPTLAELKDHAGAVRSVTLLGGERALSADVEDFVTREVIDRR